MNDARTVLVLAPSAAQQAQATELMSALQSVGQATQLLVIEGNYDQVLDALTEAVVPVVVK